MTPKIRRLIQIPPFPSANDDDFEWPSTATIANKQSTHPKPPKCSSQQRLVHPPKRTNMDSVRLNRIAAPPPFHCAYKRKRPSWSLRHNLCTGNSVPLGHINRRCQIIRLQLHSLPFYNGCKKVPRPFGPAVIGTKPKDFLQFDYLDLGRSPTGDRYVLVMRDDHSGYAWLYPTASTNAEEAVQAITDCCAAFGLPSTFMSDRPTHFRNEVMPLLSRGLKNKHHFSQAYSPWSNGAVE